MATALKPYNPFADLGELRDRIDRVFGDAFQDLTEGRRRRWTLAVDVAEENDRYLVRADLPGIKPDELKIEVADDTLTISGEHEETEEEKKRDYVRRERRFGSFTRSMSLPGGVSADDVEATFDDGVLEVSIPKPKAEEERPKSVEIKPKSGSEG